ncbi:hypothetical protein M3Y95_01076800 [Aphelenchoides besseyi]|nr:hypothetical protein M3Y95_01076800 [Aphelenchoides besseyi]
MSQTNNAEDTANANVADNATASSRRTPRGTANAEDAVVIDSDDSMDEDEGHNDNCDKEIETRMPPHPLVGCDCERRQRTGAAVVQRDHIERLQRALDKKEAEIRRLAESLPVSPIENPYESRSAERRERKETESLVAIYQAECDELKADLGLIVKSNVLRRLNCTYSTARLYPYKLNSELPKSHDIHNSHCGIRHKRMHANSWLIT